MPVKENVKNEYSVDIDKVIDIYNSKNPDLRQHTQMSLSKQLGVTAATVANWKNGVSGPIIPAIKQMMEMTGLTFDELVKKTS